MAAFDFTATMDAIGKIFTRGLKRRIENQVGIDGGGYSMPKPSKLKRRAAGKIGNKFTKLARAKVSSLEDRKLRKRGSWIKTETTAKAVNIKRLHVTHDLANRGFDYTSDASGVTVFVPDTFHKEDAPGFFGATYRDIITYNSRGQDNVNPNIRQPAPLVFPAKAADVLLMKGELDTSARLFASDLRKQLRDRGVVRAKTILTIG